MRLHTHGTDTRLAGRIERVLDRYGERQRGRVPDNAA